MLFELDDEMPTYEYLCDDCGPFTNFRPMAECDEPDDCPRCATTAPRVILTAPNFACMDASSRKSHATNEQSRHAPKTSAEYKASQEKVRHGAGCGCCSGKKPARLQTKSRSGAKGFPTARPWMISH